MQGVPPSPETALNWDNKHDAQCALVCTQHLELNATIPDTVLNVVSWYKKPDTE